MAPLACARDELRATLECEQERGREENLAFDAANAPRAR
jgi:hypothetical protein